MTALPCSRDPELWFSDQAAGVREAKRICLTECDRTARCLAWAVAHNIVEGVWGATTGRERRPPGPRRWHRGKARRAPGGPETAPVLRTGRVRRPALRPGHVPVPLSARLPREEGGGVMDIPDEAWIAAHSVADADLDEVVRAAAPIIAAEAGRRREIAVLKDWISRCELMYYTSPDRIADQMRIELANLEAGA